MSANEMLSLVEKIAREAFGAGAVRAHEQERADYDMETPTATWEEAETAAVAQALLAYHEACGEPCYWCGTSTASGRETACGHPQCGACTSAGRG